ncbi:MAG TPA: transketolase C-terminal domain-containing protein, partial [Blastocatellia bacterium]|nr:transketolase C-terminal domain-containing protein [Blastocatellia bacterium]
ESFFLNTPGLKMVEPSTPYDAKGLIKAAIRDDDPVLFFEHKLLYRHPKAKQEIPEGDYIVPIGKAAIRRAGRDLSIITYGAMVYTAMDAAAALQQEGIDAEVIDLRTLQPIDREAVIDTVKKTNKVILLHEATKTGGMAGELAAIINESAFDYLDGPITRVASIDTPVPYAPPLEEFFLPQVDDVLKAARTLAAY